jgi:hypothetical protein
MEIMLQVGGWLFCLLGAVAIYIIAQAYYYQGRVGPTLERELGFQHGAAYLRNGGQTQSAVAIVAVADNGVFAQAGFRAGDVLPGISFTELFKLLHRHRGRVTELAVVDGGEGPDFHERPRRVLRFVVPENRQKA